MRAEKTIDGDLYEKVDTIEEMVELIKEMGWDSVEQFRSEIHFDERELVGKWFAIMDNRLFVNGDVC